LRSQAAGNHIITESPLDNLCCDNVEDAHPQQIGFRLHQLPKKGEKKIA
jgi:hypothetical protein